MPAPAPVAAAGGDDALKKAKIEAAMLKAQIRKLEKLDAPDDDQQAELARLRQTLEDAEQALATAAISAPAPAQAAPGVEALKNAKIELAMQRATLKKAEQAGADAAELARLRQALGAAEQALHAAEDASGKPAPDLQRTPKAGVDERLRELKTDVAFARADLRKLERSEQPDPAALDTAQTRLSQAEQALARHQADQPAG